MNEKKLTIEKIAASGCIFLLSYIVLIIALFADSLVLLITGIIILFISSFPARKLDPLTLKGCALSGIFTLFWVGLITASLFCNASLTTRLFAALISPAGLILINLLRLSALDVSKGFAYLKKSYREIKILDNKQQP
jgi:hypothetical protein